MKKNKNNGKHSSGKEEAARLFRYGRQGKSSSETLRLLRAQGERKWKTPEGTAHPERNEKLLRTPLILSAKQSKEDIKCRQALDKPTGIPEPSIQCNFMAK